MPALRLAPRPAVLILAAFAALVAGPARADHCEPAEGHLCLQGDRFEVSVAWQEEEPPRVASAVPLSQDSGWFWLFSPDNAEVMVKVLDGRAVNGRFWVFAGSLTTLDLRIDVRDHWTGALRSYRTRVDGVSFADTDAFEDAALEDADAFADAEVFLGAPRDGAGGARAPGAARVGKAHGEEIDPQDVIDSALPHAHCENGSAAGFPCRNVDLQALVPLSELTGGPGAASGSDLWGWTDPGTGREYALMGLSDGLSFVDVTEPAAPRVVGWLPSEAEPRIWRDVKTYRNRAYVVADRVPHGMQVFDLRRLRGRGEGAVALLPDAVYTGFGPAHNLAIDEQSGFAYALGTDTCEGGLHMVDLRDPESPTFAGCFADDGYTHDAQCVLYDGPDARYRGRQVCFAANEDTLTIVDVTDKQQPRLLSRTGYPGAAYVHQAWLTEDSRFLLVDDEGDEGRDRAPTRTYVLDVRDLERPSLAGVHTATIGATDHNQYVHRGYTFQANYRGGLRILELTAPARGELREVAHFDIEPQDDDPALNGAWSVYPWLPSGNVLVSGIGQGLVVVRPDLPGFALPEAPVDLRAKVIGTTVQLEWENRCHHADGVRVYRLGPSGSEESLAELAAGSTVYVDRELAPLTAYRYRVAAFSGDAEASSAPIEVTTGAHPGMCDAEGDSLCLLGGRFAVDVEWTEVDGTARAALAEPLSSDSGWFWFFSPGNAELVVKVLDGRGVNGHFWVFTGALSDVGYTVRVTDTETGRVRSWVNPLGTLGGIADTEAFPDGP